MSSQHPPHQSRGALGNPAGRFESFAGEAVDDGWWQDDDLPPLRTTVAEDSSRSVIARNQSPDIPFDRSINPYRGCEHGCVYCFARPSHGYLGLSAGIDFETRLFAKPEAARLLDKELRARNYQVQPIAMGTNTDPYQPIERQLKITRAILETLLEFRHPVTIVTKSALVLRDIDLLARLAERNLTSVALSVTTLDSDLARRLEPRASTPAKRLAALAELARAGIPTMVMVAPVIPILTDREMENILAAAADAGVRRANWLLLRLPYETKDLFDQWLQHHRPLMREHVLNTIRGARDGALNQSEFGKRFKGSGAYAELIAMRFKLAIRKYGITAPRKPLDCSQFRPPPRAGDQLALDLGP